MENNDIVLMSNYSGSLAELRVWNVNSNNDYLHFYKRVIDGSYDLDSLKDYIPFTIA